jgi:peptidoglycan lytic transglycosylase F
MAGFPSLLDHARLPGWPARIAGPATRAPLLSALLLVVSSWSLAPRAASAAGVATPDAAATGDLPAIQRSGTLRLLVTAPDHLHRAGDPKRDELPLAVAFGRKLDLRAVPVVISDRSQLIPALRAGRGDVIVGSLAITPERAEQVLFTRPVRLVAQQVGVPKADRTPYHRVTELLVVSAKDRTTRSLADLRGGKIGVRRSSSYYEALAPLQAQHGFELETVSADEETEDILEAVAEGKLAATVADSNIVDVELTYSDAIRGADPIGEPRDIAWMLRKDRPQLRAAADRLIRRIYRGTF